MTRDVKNNPDGPVDVSSCEEDFTYEIGDDERPSEAVVRAVASFTETEVTDIEPLYYVGVDPENLDGLFEETETTALGNRSLTLTINGCHVTIEPGEVYVEQREDSD